ncbi:MAG: virulence factor [Pseudomonadota bacterium]
MPDVTIVYWRDIPAQVKVGRGRKAAKAPLTERFEQAIDRCAMRARTTDADAYTAEFRTADPYPVEGEPQAVADAEAARIEAEYGPDRIKSLIDNGGWDAR